MTAYHCRDGRRIPASIERCFAALADVATYPRWWTLLAVTPDDGDTRLRPGARLRFTGARPGGEPVSWRVDVVAVDEPRRIELAYAGDEYHGPTAWELEPAGDETEVAYVYRGVTPGSSRAAAHFARWGTRLHGVAMQEDALAGLGRYLGGPGAELDDAAWRADVVRRVTTGVRALARTLV